MSFLACIGKRSKRKKNKNQEPLDRRLSETHDHDREGTDDAAPKKHRGSRKYSKVGCAIEDTASAKTHDSAYQSLQTELVSLSEQNALLRSQLEKQDEAMVAYRDEIHRLDDSNTDMKARVTQAEAEAAKHAIENQKLRQKIVGMEENQAMMSRSELQSMISQLEEVEQRTGNKPATELSGIRTNPGRKWPVTQEDKQLSWRLSKTEARLSQSMDENKQLREDLKEMLDSHTELQMTIIADTIKENSVELLPRSSSAHARLNTTSPERQLRSTNERNLMKRLRDTEHDHAALRLAYTTLEGAFVKLQERLEEMEDQALAVVNTNGEDDTKANDSGIVHEHDLSQENNDVIELKIVETDDEADVVKPAIETKVEVEETLIETSVKSELEQLPVGNKITTVSIEKAETDIDIDTLLNKLAKQEREQNAWRMENEVLEKVCESLASRIDSIHYEIVVIQNRNVSLVDQNTEQRHELDRHVRDIENLLNDKNKANNENKRLIDENKKLTQQLQKRKDTSSITNIENVERELTDVKHKYEEANRRLKEYSNIKQVQPTKSLDLNVPSPTSLAERFRCELYEQQWKHAFHALTVKLKRDERKTVQILGEICTESYLFCKRAARIQMEAVMTSLVTPTAHHYRSGQLNKRNGVSKCLLDQLPEDLRRRLSHFRCRPTQSMVKSGVHDFLNQIDYDRTRFLRHVSERDFSEIKPYISTCFELSWCMAVQDPPMYLLFKVKHGLDIEPSIFDRYQDDGRRVDYIIWPAVFGEEGGACLQKGVAYALPERP